MAEQYKHLGVYSDWVEAARKQRPLWSVAPPAPETQSKVREVLGFSDDSVAPIDVRAGSKWERDGVVGEEVSWSVGYGPRTRAWMLKPADAEEPLPGIVALHSHDGFKFFGKEKIADGPEDPHTTIVELRERAYGGRAFANELAREGFVVLAHDVFPWGSRRFPFETMAALPGVSADEAPSQSSPSVEDIETYNAAARAHEHLVEKYCTVLGTTLAGVVAFEDRAALRYLQSRSDVLADSIGCVGLSGGGCRSALLQATSDDVRAAVVVGMMSTYEGLLDHNVVSHTWTLFPDELARFCDWTDLAACRAPSLLMVLYNRGDNLFTMDGMEAAHRRIGEHYKSVGSPDTYVGEFYDGHHKFDVPMQESAFAWLKEQLSG